MDDGRTPPPHDERRHLARVFEIHGEIVLSRALLAVARQAGAPEAALADRLARAKATRAEHTGDEDSPASRLARRLQLDDLQRAFVVAAAAATADHRVAAAVAELGGPDGLNVAAFAELHGLAPIAVHDLTQWLGDPRNALVVYGVLAPGREAPVVRRPFVVPQRVIAHLRGDDAPEPPLARLAVTHPTTFDDAQRASLARLERVLRDPAAFAVIEGISGSGRRTAVAQVAAGRRVLVLDAAAVGRHDAGPALVALRREAFLTGALPVIADIDTWRPGEPGVRHDVEVARVLDAWPGPLVVTTILSGLDLGVRRPTVRVPWPVPSPAVRRELWSSFGATRGAPPSGDLAGLSHRFRIGAGGIAQAVASARTLAGAEAPLDVPRLVDGVRNNIAQRLGSLARRVEVRHTWDDLIASKDLETQIKELIARCRHAPQVLEAWGFEKRLARGTGVAALFSGPPGTGKTLCAGLMARELDLELYEVDLSAVVSKWIGETEKHLATLFDAAEAGHALLLLDEADALLGQRTSETKSATDKYANMEVNFLLQRIETFSGIAILTTNMPGSIDQAFMRRFAKHIVFDPPDEDELARLWEYQLGTGKAPLAKDIDVDELSRAFSDMTGANVRNAALGAAFLAAQESRSVIDQDCLVRAARVEYRAMGRVLAELPLKGRSTLR